MRKATVILCALTCLGCLLYTSVHAFIPHRPRSCYDCYGRRIRPNNTYFDGCNVCFCTAWSPDRAICTLRFCQFNQCFKSFLRQRNRN